jgi:hypothetical protein
MLCKLCKSLLNGCAMICICRWDRLENGPGGRDHIVRTGLQLAQLDVAESIS